MVGLGGAPVNPPLPERPSIAVLPFANLSNDPEQEYFSDGITEDLTTDLSRNPFLFVIARNSAFSGAGRKAERFQLGRVLRTHNDRPGRSSSDESSIGGDPFHGGAIGPWEMRGRGA